MVALADQSEHPGVRVGAAEGLQFSRDPQSTELLARVAASDEVSRLRFCAALGAVRHTKGAIDDVRIVTALSSFQPGAESFDVEHKRDAIRDVAEQGRSFAVRSAARRVLWVAGTFQRSM